MVSLSEVRQQNAAWCERLYEDKAAQLLLYGRALGLSHSEAEDVVQETFVALLALENAPDNPEHYAFRAVRNRYRTGLQAGERDMEHRTAGQDDGMLDQVLQFADVPRPRVANQNLHGFGGDGVDHAAHPPCKMLHKMPYQQRNVFRTLAKWRGIFFGSDDPIQYDGIAARCPSLLAQITGPNGLPEWPLGMHLRFWPR